MKGISCEQHFEVLKIVYPGVGELFRSKGLMVEGEDEISMVVNPIYPVSKEAVLNVFE